MGFGIYPSPIGELTAYLWDTFRFPNVGASWTSKIRIKGSKRSYRWDVKDPPGQDGETQTYRGKRTKAFSIEFLLWTDSHFNNWPIFALNFQYPLSKAAKTPPVNVYHPALALIGISSVICEDLGAPEMVSDDGMWSVTVEVREALQTLPLAVTNTPPGPAPVSAPNLPGTAPNPAIQALEARISGLQSTAASLGTPGGLP